MSIRKPAVIDMDTGVEGDPEAWAQIVVKRDLAASGRDFRRVIEAGRDQMKRLLVKRGLDPRRDGVWAESSKTDMTGARYLMIAWLPSEATRRAARGETGP